MRITAIVLAAGRGTRVGADVPKQYIEIGGKPVLSYCLDSFEKSGVDDIVIVAGQDREFIEDMICRFGITKVSDIVPGGSERYFSVLNALRALEGKSGSKPGNIAAGNSDTDGIAGITSECMDTAESLKKAEPCFAKGTERPDYVLIHDGARPYITSDAIDLLIEEVKNYGAVVAAMPAKDTIKITDEEGFVKETTDRSVTWQVQTPQCFLFEDILAAYEKIVAPLAAEEQTAEGQAAVQPEADRALNVISDATVKVCEKSGKLSGCGSGKITITDDSMVYESAFPDKKVKLIDIGSENGKITSAQDLTIMELRVRK